MDGGTRINAPAQSWAKAIFAITLFMGGSGSCQGLHRRVFELPVEFEDENSAVLKFGATTVNRLQTPVGGKLIGPAVMASPAADARRVFTIAVEVVDATCAQQAARGVSLLNGPMKRAWGIRTARSQDPDGYI